MEVFIMPTTSSLVAKLSHDFPNVSFVKDDLSRWSAVESTVYYNLTEPHVDWIILHELSHACLKHTQYTRDIALLAMERDAWQHAADALAPRYGITIDEDFIEDHLDTYRDWLHAKSTCPACTQNGMEYARKRYRCLACGHEWRTNNGTQTRIRRYTVNTPL